MHTDTPGSEGEKRLQKEFNTTADALRFYNKQVLTYLAPLMQKFPSSQIKFGN